MGAGPTARWYPEADPEAGERVAKAFHDAYGRAPDGLWAAPGRVNVIGEHVDYQAGLCLPFALPQRTVAAVALRDDDELHLRSAQISGAGASWSGRLADVAPGLINGWAGYVAGVPWALRQAGAVLPGIDVLVDSSVPVGAGLSSSAALECAVALALDDLVGLGLGADDAGRAELAAACVRAENEIAGAPTGGLDQAAALRSRAGHALLLDCRDFTIRQVPFDLGVGGARALELLVMDTRAHHALVDGQYGTRRDACLRACELLGVPALRDVPADGLADALRRLSDGDPQRADELGRRARHVVTEIDRVRQVVQLLESGRVRDLGPVLDASHASLRDDYEVSSPELDVACETAEATGALGARMTGGGFGGSAIALVESAGVEAVAEAVAAAFADRGWGAPAFLRATPAGPGSRIG